MVGSARLQRSESNPCSPFSGHLCQDRYSRDALKAAAPGPDKNHLIFAACHYGNRSILLTAILCSPGEIHYRITQQFISKGTNGVYGTKIIAGGADARNCQSA